MDGIRINLSLDGADQVQAGAQRAAAGLNTLGQASAKAEISAKQLQAAYGQLPAQLQDFFIQIQGGQSIFTAFLQQGSQVAGSFGGVGNAVRALGAAISPTLAGLGLLAGGLGALSLAYMQGSKESEAFARALILSGNAAGTTVGQLNALARAQGEIAGTQGQAAEALAALAATGQVTGDALIKAGDAAARLARVDVPLAETVKKFAALGKDPLKAVIDLNEAENFLTESVYKQIKALSEQGRVVEAAALAQQTYADVGITRAEKLTQSLGTLQRAWKSVGEEAARFWDNALGVGRAQTTEDRIKSLQQELEGIDAKFARQSKPLFGSSITTAAQDAAALDKRKSAIRDLLGELSKKLDIERLNANAEAASAQSVKSLIRADEDAAKAAKALAAERDRDAAALEKVMGLSGSYQKDLSELNKLRQAGKLTEEQYVSAVEKLIQAQPVVREQLQEQARAQKEAIELWDDLMRAEERRIEALQKVGEQVRNQVQGLRDEEAAIAVAAEKNVSLAAAIELVREARANEAREKALAFGDKAAAAALQEEINARRELAGLINDKEARAAAKKGAEEAAREWKRASDEIERTITDSLMRGFESGKGFVETLRDTLVNTFKTLVLRPTIQALVQPVAGSLLGLPGAGSVQAGGSPFGSFNPFSDFGGSTVAGLSRVGGFLANNGFEGAADWLSANSGTIGQIAGTAGDALGYLNAFKQLQNGNYGAAAGSAIGTYFGGPIGSAIGNAIGGAIDKAFGSVGAKQSGASYLSNGVTGQAVNNGMFGLDRAWGDSIGRYFNQDVQSALKAITGTAAGLLNTVATSFGDTAAYQVGAFYASDATRPSQGNYSVLQNGQVLSSSSRNNYDADPTKGLNQLTSALAGQVRDALAQVNIPGWARAQIESLTGDVSFEQLSNNVQAILATQQALKSLGSAMPQLANLADGTVTALLAAFNGIENLNTAASAYYDAFYTQAERNAGATQQLGAALQTLGLQLPTTREAYRQLVEAQDLNTESGRAAYAQLIKLSPAFAALVPATQELADSSVSAAAKMVEAGRKVLADLVGERGNLQVELLTAQGDSAAALALARQQALDKLTAGLSATDAAAAAAAYDYNAALRTQIEVLNAAAAAAQQAAAQGDGIQQQIDQLLGNTTALRARELAALDPVNRALQERYYALLDEQAATQAAAQAAQELASKQAAVAAQGDSIQARIDELLGNTAAIRARELAALDPANRALQEYYFQLLDAKAAQEAATQAAAEAARVAEQQAQAAKQMRDAWKSIGDTLVEEAQRILGLSKTDAALSRAQAEGRFTIATAQARAGDQEAAKLLPQLGRSFLDLVADSATSRAELERARAQVAASLQGTASVLGGVYGFQSNGSSVDVSALLAQVAASQPITTIGLSQQQTAVSAQLSIVALVEEVKALHAEVAALQESAARTAAATEKTRDVLVLVTNNGDAMEIAP